MQALCGLQGIFDLFNCKTPAYIFPRKQGRRTEDTFLLSFPYLRPSPEPRPGSVINLWASASIVLNLRTTHKLKIALEAFSCYNIVISVINNEEDLLWNRCEFPKGITPT